jgi:TMEM175 potassium channel family protein
VSDTGRLETFADGVFAIAITLLVLGIHLPAPDVPLGPALLEQWPEFGAYVVSFLTIGIMWVQHHRLFTVIGRSNATFAMINVVFLLFIAFIPFPTDVVAQRLASGYDVLGATLLYGATTVAIAAMFNVIWLYAASRGGHLLDAAALAHRERPRGYWLGVPIYLGITLLALINPWLSLIGFAAFAVYWALPISGTSGEPVD